MRETHLILAAGLALFGLAGGRPLHAQAQDGFRIEAPLLQFTVRGGVSQHLMSGDLFRNLSDVFTLDRGGFTAASVSAEVAGLIGNRIDIALSAGRTNYESRSEYRRWEGDDGLPIEQTAWLRVTPVTASVRYLLGLRGRHVGSFAWVPSTWTPYVGAGAGVAWYRFEQEGEFVDYEDTGIYRDRVESEGSGLSWHIGGGIQRWFTPRWGLGLDLRYSWGTAGVTGAFEDHFRNADLSGVQAALGLSLRP